MLALDSFRAAEVTFVDYGSPEHANLPAEPGMVFADMTPPRERVQEFVDAGATVLDHHAYAKDIVEQFGSRGIYSDEPGVSGAVLFARYGWNGPSLYGHRFAALVGIRDTWQKDHDAWERARQLHAVLMQLPRDYWCGHSDGIDHAMTLSMALGACLLKERKAKVDKALRHLMRESITIADGKSLKWGVFSDPDNLISDVAEHARQTTDLDVVIGWRSVMVDGEFVDKFSLRSTNYDVGALARHFGGGGHKAAAGFTAPCAQDPVAMSWLIIRELIIK
jgi:oligoribonuclease NrnB/cAMP/cGMP phosphodiesterase (DHH superfamily)